jgi:hypothetical protein
LLYISTHGGRVSTAAVASAAFFLRLIETERMECCERGLLATPNAFRDVEIPFDDTSLRQAEGRRELFMAFDVLDERSKLQKHEEIQKLKKAAWAIPLTIEVFIFCIEPDSRGLV